MSNATISDILDAIDHGDTEALEKLEAEDAALGDVVKLRFFADLDETCGDDAELHAVGG